MSPEVEEYLRLGLAMGRHQEGFVDAYYGPPELATGPLEPPPALVERARRLLAELDTAATDLEPARRTWLAAQVRGVHTSARRLAGEALPYLEEIESCYGVRPDWVPEDVFSEAHRRLASVLPPGGRLDERYNTWREAQVVPPDRLRDAVLELAEDWRERTGRLFGLPEGEQVEFEFVTGQPWSGFNYYLGQLRSRVAVNTDLPVLSLSLGHLVAHETYPGHHTEHCRKEAGLVRRRRHLEETIKLVGTPECLISEGLADLGLEVVAGAQAEPVVASHLHPLGVPFDGELAAQVRMAGEALGMVRGNAAIGIHDRGWTAEEASGYMQRWALLPKNRADKGVAFVTDPVWRAYPFCYTEGLRICRSYVGGDPARFERLITEPVVPEDLQAAT